MAHFAGRREIGVTFPMRADPVEPKNIQHTTMTIVTIELLKPGELPLFVVSELRRSDYMPATCALATALQCTRHVLSARL